MKILDDSIVQAHEIDSLGHMNVRYYMQRMERANLALLRNLEGGDSDAREPAAKADLFEHHILMRTDTYTRFRQEQFEGARLHTLGGVLGIDGAALKTFVEIRNAATDAAAASFIVTSTLTGTTDRKPSPIGIPTPADVIGVPDYAQPRSLSLGPIRTDVTLALLDERIAEVEGGGMMSGRRSATIDTQDVDAEGWLRPDIELLFLPYAKFAAQQQTQQGPPVFTSEEGHRIGWAIMETRNQSFGVPRLGTRLRYFNADIDLAAKSRHSRRWVFNEETGELLGTSDSIGLCIDLDERRAVDWPRSLRAQIEENMQPGLA